MIAEIISAGAGILGSLFGSDDEEQTTTSTVDYKEMVRKAEAAGFNPLTAIRNGGSAGFTTSTTTGGALSSQNFIGKAMGAIGTAADAFANFDPHADQRREAEFNLMNAQIANLNADTGYKGRMGMNMAGGIGSVPSSVVGTGARSMGGGGNAGALTLKSGGAIVLPVNTANTPASVWSEWYGEPGDWVGGAANMIDDGMRAITGGATGPAHWGRNIRKSIGNEWDRLTKLPRSDQRKAPSFGADPWLASPGMGANTPMTVPSWSGW